MTDTLLSLAERCERADGPDRELDVSILTHTSIGYRDVHGDGMMFDKGNDGYWFVDDCSIRQLPSPTASIDAALTLAEGDAVDVMIDALRRLVEAGKGIDALARFTAASALRSRKWDLKGDGTGYHIPTALNRADKS